MVHTPDLQTFKELSGAWRYNAASPISSFMYLWSRPKRNLLAFSALLLFFASLALFNTDTVGKTLRGVQHKPISQRKTLDIVVSTYKENATTLAATLLDLRALAPLRNLETRIIVYTKDEAADVDALKQTLSATSVLQLPNRGREGGAYLTHIIDNWDQFADHTLFMQAEMHDYKEAKDRLVDYFIPSTGVLSIGRWYNICSCTSCSDFWDPSREFPRLLELWSAINGELCPGNGITMGYGGQTIVSRPRIMSTKKEIYLRLKEVLESQPDHWIHSDPHEDQFEDKPGNPYFGHTLERSWQTLFGCWDPTLSQTCPELIYRRERGDLDSKCQCLDVDL